MLMLRLPRAVDATAAFGLVRVAPGTYATGGGRLSGHNVATRVGIENQVAIRATGSAGETIIPGDANTRCVAVRRQAVAAHVQGFTLKDGTADAGTADADGLGGGFYALLNLLYYILVVFGRQRLIFFCYCLMTPAAKLLSDAMVRRSGIPGAAASYLLTMAVLSLLFAAAAFRERDFRGSGNE